ERSDPRPPSAPSHLGHTTPLRSTAHLCLRSTVRLWVILPGAARPFDSVARCIRRLGAGRPVSNARHRPYDFCRRITVTLGHATVAQAHGRSDALIGTRALARRNGTIADAGRRAQALARVGAGTIGNHAVGHAGDRAHGLGALGAIASWDSHVPRAPGS